MAIKSKVSEAGTTAQITVMVPPRGGYAKKRVRRYYAPSSRPKPNKEKEPELTEEQKAALMVLLDEAAATADRIVANMDVTIDVLRSSAEEVRAAHQALRRSNEIAAEKVRVVDL